MADWNETLVGISSMSLLLYAVLVLIELGLEWRSREKFYSLKDTLCSLTTGGMYLLVQVLMRGIYIVALVFAHQFALFDIETNWWSIILCYLVVDFVFYWHHRIVHEVRLGWAAHSVHHSSQHYNLGATAFRQSLFEAVFEPWFYVPIALLGFDPIVVLIAVELNLIYMFWPHTQRIGKLPAAFEWLFVTPSHHRVHHACNLQYLDKNYSGTFIIWDRLFGTFAEEKEKPKFGILHPVDSHNPLIVSFSSWGDLFRDLKKASGIRAWLGYLFMPPGWAPDGEGLTTRQMQAQGSIEPQSVRV
ncbi:MAG: sterol desaturase family protein [Halieaceae bacterium]|nr:sterol desaturase family protein [Halieaceae bacterium]MCP5164860.1 sterol desaturase family protein [Pseudomonadales bacterium]MCP5205329.1 sterol desaturase family protein [Pseudomonadales bacterium]